MRPAHLQVLAIRTVRQIGYGTFLPTIQPYLIEVQAVREKRAHPGTFKASVFCACINIPVRVEDVMSFHRIAERGVEFWFGRTAGRVVEVTTENALTDVNAAESAAVNAADNALENVTNTTTGNTANAM